MEQLSDAQTKDAAMPEKITSLIHVADYLGVLILYGIAMAFGGVGGFCGASIVLLKIGGLSRWKKGLALILGLSVAGSLCSLMVFTGILSYEAFTGVQILTDVDMVLHLSVFTGFFTSIAMMLANKGISHVSLKYGNTSIDVEMNKDKK